MITEESSKLIKELRNYKWKKNAKDEKENKPVDAFNHGIDAMRYAAMNKLGESESWVMWG